MIQTNFVCNGQVPATRSATDLRDRRKTSRRDSDSNMPIVKADQPPSQHDIDLKVASTPRRFFRKIRRVKLKHQADAKLQPAENPAYYAMDGTNALLIKLS